MLSVFGSAAEIKRLDKHIARCIIETELAGLAGHRDAVNAGDVDRGLGMLQASNGVPALPVADDLHGVITERRDDQQAALGIPTEVVHAPVNAWQGNPGTQGERRNFSQRGRKAFLLGRGLA